jgi:hypothetical protein
MLKPVTLTKNENREEVNDSFEVEKIRKHRLRKGQGYEYLVKWKHYPEEDNSWVLAKNFNNLKPIIKYWKNLKQQTRKSKDDKPEEYVGAISEGSYVTESLSNSPNNEIAIKRKRGRPKLKKT